MVHDLSLIAELKEYARAIRYDSIYMIHKAQGGHPGGCLSYADILACLYFHVLRVDPENPSCPHRDRFVLSKGHCCPALYSALYRRGFFDKTHLDTLRKFGSILQGHPDMRKTPGLDMSSGSLGNGLSAGLGMAISAIWKKQDYRVYVQLGDGEMQEGIVWEAIMFAGHHNVFNLTAIVDINGLQLTGFTDQIMSVNSLVDKFQAFCWNAIEIDGHSIPEILDALYAAKKNRNRPTAILAHTIKGKGVSFMENEVIWHSQVICDEDAALAYKEIMGRD